MGQSLGKNLGKKQTRLIPLWVYPTLLIFAVGTVALRLKTVGMTYTIGQLDNRIRNLRLNQEQAELKLAAARSPRRLEGLARTKFHLTQPRTDQVVYVK